MTPPRSAGVLLALGGLALVVGIGLGFHVAAISAQGDCSESYVLFRTVSERCMQQGAAAFWAVVAGLVLGVVGLLRLRSPAPATSARDPGQRRLNDARPPRRR